MNERIRELLVELKKTVSTHRGDAVLIGYDEIEKFAELIVRMCADAADMYEGKSDCVGDCVAEYMGYGQEEGVTEWRAK